MSLRSDTIPYSRIKSNEFVSRLSADIAPDVGLGYDLVEGASRHSGQSTSRIREQGLTYMLSDV